MTAPALSLRQARRISIDAQRLGAFREGDLMALLDRIRCVQFDPINHVARTQMLVLYARLGRSFDAADLDRALFETRSLFHYWAHAASFVLTEDYPVHRHTMDGWPPEGGFATKVEAFMKANSRARRAILEQLAGGAMRSKELEVPALRSWESTGWTDSQTVTRLLDFMWTRGEIMIAGRRGLERLWARSEDWFPSGVLERRLAGPKAIRRAVGLSARALGIGTEKHIRNHFVPWMFSGEKNLIEPLVESGELLEFEVGDSPAPWYVHRDNLDLVDSSGAGWRGRTELLSPFDNLIRDRARNLTLFDFDYTIEIYVPKNKRRFGYYVLPILDGDRLVGRIDSRMDRKTGIYSVENVYAEEHSAKRAAIGDRVQRAIARLGRWLGAERVEIGKVPPGWAGRLGK